MMPQTVLVRVGPRCLTQLWRWRAALLVGLALSLGLVSEVRAATTWTVCASGCDYTSIKSAIAAPTTVDGDTLAIGAGTYTEAGITVDKSLTLQGEDADTTIVQAAPTPGTASDRVFTIPNGVTVALQALTIRYGNVVGDGGGVWNGGTLTVTASTVRGNRATHGSRLSFGGGLYNQGTLTLTNSTVSGNVVGSHGGGLFNDYGVGPTGIGSTTLTNSTVRENTAGCCGGGLSNFDHVTLTNSTVRENTANFRGGGLFNDGDLRLTNSTVRENTAGVLGGGLWDQTYVQLTNSTVSHNAAAQGGGLASAGGGRVLNSTISGNRAADGGGLYLFGPMMVTNSTISGNMATGNGGGLYYDNTSDPSSWMPLINSTVSDNAAPNGGGVASRGPLRLKNSIVANSPDGGDCVDLGAVTDDGFNIIEDGSCIAASTSRSGDPHLGPLQDNGGPTFTHALLPGSPALDAIPWGANDCGTSLIGDQRWQARPQPTGGACDIGAYEVAVAGQALGGWVTGVTPHTVVCQNVTTGQEVTLSAPASPWDCEAAGLGVTAGDRVSIHARGPLNRVVLDVGGAVAGMAASGGGCTNRTTGQQVKFQGMRGATAASCVAAGLVIHLGDRVQMRVRGVAE